MYSLIITYKTVFLQEILEDGGKSVESFIHVRKNSLLSRHVCPEVPHIHQEMLHHTFIKKKGETVIFSSAGK